MQVLTDIQYKANAHLTHENNIYLVSCSIDYHWFTKDDKYLNKYLTQMTLIGTIEETKPLEN